MENENKKVWIVERQSQYDGGYVMCVFNTEDKARSYIENKKDFKGWDTESQFSDGRTTHDNSNDFYYSYDDYDLNKDYYKD